MFGDTLSDRTMELDGQDDTTALIGHLTVEDQKRAMFVLSCPDFYPAHNVATSLDCKVSTVWAWRRARGIYKARS